MEIDNTLTNLSSPLLTSDNPLQFEKFSAQLILLAKNITESHFTSRNRIIDPNQAHSVSYQASIEIAGIFIVLTLNILLITSLMAYTFSTKKWSQIEPQANQRSPEIDKQFQMIQGEALNPYAVPPIKAINQQLLPNYMKLDDSNISGENTRRTTLQVGEGRNPTQSSDNSILMMKFGFNKYAKGEIGDKKSSQINSSNIDALLDDGDNESQANP